MPFYGPADIFEKAANTIATVSGNDFTGQTRTQPTQNGSATRQMQLKPNRLATAKRQVMRFIVPEQPIVNMYINPQQVQYQYSKLITPQRAKGGYILQYWSENLGTLNVQGTTGTSGIEGINVLLDVYRNEQLMFDPYGLMLAAEADRKEQESFDDLLFGGSNILNPGGLLGDIAGLAGDFLDSAQNQNIIKSRNKPTLASLAFTVEIYWCGEIYRGYFESFNFTESSEHVGLFDYSFIFKFTQKRGFRTNFLAWHKDPNYGQSNWGAYGPPKSYSGFGEEAQPSRNNFDQPGLFESLGEGLRTFAEKTADNNRNKLNLLNKASKGIIDAFGI